MQEVAGSEIALKTSRHLHNKVESQKFTAKMSELF